MLLSNSWQSEKFDMLVKKVGRRIIKLEKVGKVNIFILRQRNVGKLKQLTNRTQVIKHSLYWL